LVEVRDDGACRPAIVDHAVEPGRDLSPYCRYIAQGRLSAHYDWPEERQPEGANREPNAKTHPFQYGTRRS